MKIASGSYSGNGTSQDVTGLGAAADLVIIKGGSIIATIWTSTMGAGARKPMTGATAVGANGVTQHASGFSVGSDAAVNTNATTYYYVAIQDNAVADFQVGSYTGNGSDGRSLTPLDFDPNLVIIASAGADACTFRVSTHNGDQSALLTGTTVSDHIQSFVTNGWTVGTNSRVNNADARTYYYAAIKNTTNLFKVIDDGSNRAYLGDGATDNRSITGAGFQPDALAVVKSTGNFVGVARFKAHTGDQTAEFDTGSSTQTDRIQAYEADGFQIGLSNRVATNATDHHAFVLKEGSSAAAATLRRSSISTLGVG